MKNLSALLIIIRPINLAITYVTVIAGVFVAGSNNVNTEILLGALSLTFAAAAGYVINDIIDLSIDKINRPNRPLPLNQINTTIAYVYYYLLTLLSLISALYISNAIFIFIFIINLIVFYYSYSLKTLPLVGNITVALLTSSAFIMSGLLTQNIETSLIPSFFAFLVNFIREIVKDIEDLDGDTKENVFTFPAQYGIKRSVSLINTLLIVLLLSTLIPYIFNIYSVQYIIVVMLGVNIVLVYILKEINKNTSNKNLKKISDLLKLAMIIGLIAIYLGTSFL